MRIEYIATDPDRQTIPFVRTINEKGETTEYVVEGTTPEDMRAVSAASKASVDQAALSPAIAATQDLYRTNVFPTMKVTWGTYRDNIGHTTSDGCFRCHDGSHVAHDGSAINADCASRHGGP